MHWWNLQTKSKMCCLYFLLLWFLVSNQLVKFCWKIVIATSFWLVPSSLLNELLSLGVGVVNLVAMSVVVSGHFVSICAVSNCFVIIIYLFADTAVWSLDHVLTIFVFVQGAIVQFHSNINTVKSRINRSKQKQSCPLE